MASALLENAVEGKVRVSSAGTEPADQLNPGKRYEDWDLEDPAGKDLETVRRIRDQIRGRVERLIPTLIENEERAQEPVE